MLRAVLGLGVNLIVARWLGPQDFGLFWLFVVTMIFGENLLGEGLNPSVVRYYASSTRDKNNPSLAYAVFSSAFALRLALGIPVTLLGWAGGDWIAQTFFHNELYALPLRFGLIGALGVALWNFNLAIFQAREDFGTYALMTPVVNLLRIITIPVLIGIGQLHLTPILGLHVAFFYLGTGVGFWLLRDHFSGFALKGSLIRDLLHFSKWTAAANLCFLLQSHLGVFVLSFFLGANVAGIYAAAASLLLVVEHLTVTLLTVQLPAVSKFTELVAYQRYVRHSVWLSTGVALALSPAIFLASPLILFLYGPAYDAAIPVFQILLLGLLGPLITHPLYLVFYAMDRPQLYTITAATSLAGWLIAATWCIPTLGAVGAAWATLCARLIDAALIVSLLWRTLSRWPHHHTRGISSTNERSISSE